MKYEDYERIQSEHSHWTREHKSAEELIRGTVLEFSRYLQEDSTILEIGCGDGLALDIFLECGLQHLTGCDINEKKLCVAVSTGHSVTKMDAHHLGFTDARFDAVYSTHTLEHCYNGYQAVAEMRRVLKPGGVLFLVVPDHSWAFEQELFLTPEEIPTLEARDPDYWRQRYAGRADFDVVNRNQFPFGMKLFLAVLVENGFDILYACKVQRSGPELWAVCQRRARSDVDGGDLAQTKLSLIKKDRPSAVLLQTLGPGDAYGHSIAKSKIETFTSVSRQLLRGVIRTLPLALWRKVAMSYLARLTNSRNPQKGLIELLNVDNVVYSKLERLAARTEDVHPKRRLTNYHTFFTERIGPREQVLDVCCGDGALTYDIAQATDGLVVGIDIPHEDFLLAQQTYRRDNLRFVMGDPVPGVPGERFDVLVFSDAWEYMQERVSSMRVALASTGARKVLIRVPMFEREWLVPLKKELGVEYRLNSTHRVEFSEAQLRQELADSGLVPDEIVTRFGEFWCQCSLAEQAGNEVRTV